MKFILFDDVNETIMGLSSKEQLDYESGWYTLSDEAYDFILQNNGSYLVNVSSIKDKIEQYKTIVENYKNHNCILNYIVVDTDNLYMKDKQLINVIRSKIRKNNSYCNMYIENGIYYDINEEEKHFTYKLEDQMNYNEIKDLINNNLIEDNIPIKASEDDEYIDVSIDIFNEIYNKLIKNKFYQLFYLRQYNEYIKSLDDITTIEKLPYEIELPEPYLTNLNEQLSKLKL